MCSIVEFIVLENDQIIARIKLNFDEDSFVPDARPLVMCCRELEALVQHFTVDSQLQRFLVAVKYAIAEGDGRIVGKCAANFELDRVALEKVCAEALARPVTVVVGPDVDAVQSCFADVVDARYAAEYYLK